MSLTLHEIKNIFSGKTFKMEGLQRISNYSFTDNKVFPTDSEGKSGTEYEIYKEEGAICLKTKLPIFGVNDMIVNIEKVKNFYIIITLFNKKDNTHIITLEQTLQQ